MARTGGGLRSKSVLAASSADRSEQMRRSAENKLRVVAVRIDPVIEQRLRVLAEATGRKQSFFCVSRTQA